MPPRAKTRRAPTADAEAKKAAPKPKKPASAPARRIVLPNVNADGEKVPAPVAAIVSVIHPATGMPDASAGGATTGHLPPSSSPVEVEVETRQGYVLTGRLVALDDFYNVTLQDATSRRERPCDVERALMRERIEHTARASGDPFFPGYGGPAPALDEATEALLEEYRERPDSLARPRFVGTTMVRSSNLVMIRFMANRTPALVTSTASAPDTTLPTSADGKASTAQGSVLLAQRFSSMAAGVKKALALQKLQNRRERRQRLEDAKKKKQKESES